MPRAAFGLGLGSRHRRTAAATGITALTIVTAPVISGGTGVGSTLTVATPAVWSGTPASRIYQWYQDATAIPGAASTSYVTVGGDFGHSITVKEQANNGALSTPSQSNAIVVASSGGLATPTNLRNLSATGAAPLILGFDWTAPGTDSVSGYRGQLQIDGNSDFSSPEQSIVFLMDAASVEGLSESIGLVTPSGAYNSRLRILLDNENGATTVTDQFGNTFTCDASAWSNTFSDTIAVSVALLVSTTGTSKSRFINVATPFHQAISPGDVGSPCCVRSSIAMAVAKGHFEFTIDGLHTSASGAVGCGITDAATQDFNATGFNGTRPGSGSNIPGVTVRVIQGSTALAVYANGGSTSPSVPNGAVPAVGDAVIFEVDVAANTVAIYYYRLATTTATQIGSTIMMSGAYIPAAIWAYGATERGTATLATSDAFTFNPGYATFLRASSAGFSPYG